MLSSKIYYNDKINIHTSSKCHGHPMILIYTLRHNFMATLCFQYTQFVKTLLLILLLWIK
jgi:hypothetical protein